MVAYNSISRAPSINVTDIYIVMLLVDIRSCLVAHFVWTLSYVLALPYVLLLFYTCYIATYIINEMMFYSYMQESFTSALTQIKVREISAQIESCRKYACIIAIYITTILL